MEVVFDKNTCKYLTKLIDNPGNKKHIRKFEQEYHSLTSIFTQRKVDGMKAALNAEEYNQIYNTNSEGLEVLQGVRDEKNHEFKTRIIKQNPHRMGMYCIDYLKCKLNCQNNECCTRDCDNIVYLSRKDWKVAYKGDYQKVTHLYVCKLHHHDY